MLSRIIRFGILVSSCCAGPAVRGAITMEWNPPEPHELHKTDSVLHSASSRCFRSWIAISLSASSSPNPTAVMGKRSGSAPPERRWPRSAPKAPRAAPSPQLSARRAPRTTLPSCKAQILIFTIYITHTKRQRPLRWFEAPPSVNPETPTPKSLRCDEVFTCNTCWTPQGGSGGRY